MGGGFGFYNVLSTINQKLPKNIYKDSVEIFGKVNTINNQLSNSLEIKLNYIKLKNKVFYYQYKKIIIVNFHYFKAKKIIRNLQYGDVVSLKVKLKKNEYNKFSATNFSKNILAKAYLIKYLNKKDYFDDNTTFLLYLNDYIHNKVSKYSEIFNNKYLIHGLLLGDKSNISKDEKLLFQNTGVSHLFAISGMHLGAVFFLGCYIFGLIWSLIFNFLYFKFKLTKKMFSIFGGLFFMFFYGLISGFALPTIRAFIFIIINSLENFIPIKLKKSEVIGLTLIIITILNPFCYLDIGFWLSFSMVILLFFLNNIKGNLRNNFYRIICLPIELFIISAPISLFFFQKIPIVSPFVNIIAIPFVNILVLPFLIFALAFISIPALSKFFLFISDLLLEDFIIFLKMLDWQKFINLPIDYSLFVIISFFTLLFFTPNKLPGKFISSIALVLIIFNSFIKKPNYYTIESKLNNNFISYYYS